MKAAPVHIAALAVLGALWLVLAYCLPALPVDETRYLSVAWEMHQSGHWLLPTLNGHPYSHKPPLLFWLINFMWVFAGPQLWAARLVPLVSSAAAFLATRALAHRLFPRHPEIALLAPLLFMAGPAFMIYGGLILFDMPMAAISTLALAFVWDAAQGGGKKSWLLFGLMAGMGVLDKGPVILLYAGLPALAVPFLALKQNISKAGWYKNLGFGILVAAAVGLAWAIPAAVDGGKHFAEMIFWKQSTGRMVESFAHRRPVWFYLPFVPGFFLPLLFWPPVWRGIKNFKALSGTPEIRFLLCSTIPAFICFSLISGKQPHYLLPLLPPACVLLAALIEKTAAASRPRDSAFVGGFFCLFAAGLTITIYALAARNPHDRLVTNAVSEFNPWILWVASAAALGLALALRRHIETQLLAAVAGLALFCGIGAVHASRSALTYLNLQPLADAIQPYKNGPMAFAPEGYEGEITWLARLDKPLDVVNISSLPTWFTQHPGGIAVILRKEGKPPSGEHAVASLSYRAKEAFILVDGYDKKQEKE